MFLGWDWSFRVEDDLKTLIFLGFPLESALEVNKLVFKESLSLVVVMMVRMILVIVILMMY